VKKGLIEKKTTDEKEKKKDTQVIELDNNNTSDQLDKIVLSDDTEEEAVPQWPVYANPAV